jgi:predicted transcriptional regulator YdeE
MNRNPKDLKYKVVPKFKDSRAKAQLSGHTVISKPYTRRSDIAHEEGHYMLGHKNGLPKTPQSYVHEEIDACRYAHAKLSGKPEHIKGQLRAIYNDTIHYDYKETPKAAIKIIDNELKRKGTPVEWRKDWRGIKERGR